MNSILLLTSLIFLCPKAQVNPEQAFAIHINYVTLPGGMLYSYSIAGNTVTVKKYGIALSPTRHEVLSDSATFKIKAVDELRSFVYQMNWNSIPRLIKQNCIDGYSYKLTITRQADSFKYSVTCSQHPDLDRLLRLCNAAIPDKRYREKFKLVVD